MVSEFDGLKVGDLVRTTKDHDGCVTLFPIGSLGKIIRIEETYNLPYRIEVGGRYFWYNKSMFVLATSETPKNILEEFDVGMKTVRDKSFCLYSDSDEDNRVVNWNDVQKIMLAFRKSLKTEMERK